jgi:hypothetical protein
MTSSSSQERPASSVIDGPGGLLESLALGTGFDIAMAHYGLLPREPDADFPPEVQPDATPTLAAHPLPDASSAVADAMTIHDPALLGLETTDTSWLFLAFGG